MLVVLTSASYCVEILPAFAKHYASLGAETIYISVLELVPGLLDKTNEVASRCAIPVRVYPASARWQKTKLEAQNKSELRIRVGLKMADWYVPADLDEFIDFKRPILEVADEMTSGGYGYATGTFSDRVSEDGSLSIYDPSKSLWDQYPRRAPVTKDLMQSKDMKVVLARGHLAVCSGHHFIVDESYKKYPTDFTIDHFAWRAGRREAMQRRLENYTKLGIKCEPLNRILDHLTENNGKLSLGLRG